MPAAAARLLQVNTALSRVKYAPVDGPPSDLAVHSVSRTPQEVLLQRPHQAAQDEWAGADLPRLTRPLSTSDKTPASSAGSSSAAEGAEGKLHNSTADQLDCLLDRWGPSMQARQLVAAVIPACVGAGQHVGLSLLLGETAGITQ